MDCVPTTRTTRTRTTTTTTTTTFKLIDRDARGEKEEEKGEIVTKMDQQASELFSRLTYGERNTVEKITKV